MNHVSPPQADRPIPDLLRDLTAEIKTLITDELELVKLELSRKGKKAGESAGFFGVTTVLALGAFLALTTTLIALIAVWLPVWAAALIVTVLYGAGAAISANAGKEKLQAAAGAPSTTAQSVARDVEAARAGVQRGR